MKPLNLLNLIFALPMLMTGCGSNSNAEATDSASAWQQPSYEPYETDSFETANGHHVCLTFIKHGTLMFDIDGYIIHIDPVLMFGTDYSQLPKADLLLVTHDHPDHYDADAVEAVSKPSTRFYSNGKVAQLSGKSNALAAGESITTDNGITIAATQAYNNSKGREQFHPKGANIGFLVSIDGFTIYVAGDTEDIDEMGSLKDIDVAFLPVNQPFTMTPQQCIHAIEMFMPRIVYPYHYGETDLTPVVDHFEQHPSVEVRVRQLQ